MPNLRDLDLSSPRAKHLLNEASKRAGIAYRSAQTIVDAVRPVFALDQRQRRFNQTGSCVLVNIYGEVFALSASHVLEEVGPYPLPVGCGGAIHYLAGSRFSSSRGPSGTHRDDPIDAAVFRCEDSVPPAVRAAAISIDQLDSVPGPGASFFAAVGFRAKMSVRTAAGFQSHQDTFPSTEHAQEVYLQANIDPVRMIALAFDDKILVGDKWQKAPKPAGMSGGAIVRIEGLPASLRESPAPIQSPKL